MNSIEAKTNSAPKLGLVPGSAVLVRRDFLEEHARELLGVSDKYTTLRWQRQPENPPFTHVVVTMGICSDVYKSGPRKGRTNYAARDKSADRQVIFSDKDHDAWLLAWEEKTGKCHECQGTGQEWAGWSRDEGTKYRPCRRCRATGVPLQNVKVQGRPATDSSKQPD